MGIETAAADHACNVVRRQIQEEFPELTFLYIVHSPGERQKALEAKNSELTAHPAGEVFLPHLGRLAEQDGPEFSGIAIKAEKKFIKFLAREKTLACFFVNSDLLENPDDARRHALFLAYHALSLIENRKMARNDDFLILDDIITPKPDDILRVWKNMLADTFSVLVLELGKKRDSIGELGRMRSMATLSAIPDAKPEHYPFPLVLDATRLLYHDMVKEPTGMGVIRRALEMTHEIGETFDRTSVRQWWAFSRTAQEMAWMGASPNAILGAAVYNSEDPYARATAYLVAEALNIQTLSAVPSGSYNPFADAEVSERHHLKICEERFRTVISKANIQNNSDPFIEEVQKQNKKLLEGNPLGWCAWPLLCAEVFYRNSPGQARGAFDKAMMEANWNKVQDVIKMIVLLRREGKEITPAFVAEKLEEVDDLKFLSPCFLR
jgi:hypothetical protein